MFFSKAFRKKLKLIVMKSKGITLIEVVIALALLGILLASLFSFFSFSANTLNTAQNKSNVQHGILMAAEFITKELRTATSVFISSGEMPSEVTEPYSSHLGLNDGHLDYLDMKGSKQIANASIIEINFTLDYPRNLIKFLIVGDEDGQQYKIESEVILLNIEGLSDEELSGSWIHYIKP